MNEYRVLLRDLTHALADAQNNESDLSTEVLTTLYNKVCDIVTEFEELNS